jgi:hypothetical protein
MNSGCKSCLLAAVALFGCFQHGTADAQNVSKLESTAPFEVLVPYAPVTVEGTDNREHLVYELQITNFAPVPATLTRFEVLPGTASKAPILDLTGRSLDSLIVHPGLEPEPKEKRVFVGNGRVILFVWLALSKDKAAPERLLQKLYFSTPDSETGKLEDVEIDATSVIVSKQKPLVLTPPLRGGNWIAGNGPSNTSVHRRADFPFYGSATIAERYACDFVRLGEDGMAFTGDKTKNENWHGFGAEVVSVADGTVVDVQDGIPENVPLSADRPVAINTQTSGGNYITVDIGGGYYAFFAHLQPKSLRVKIGDHVKRGQMLGRLGNTGNSTNPHLHFHVATGRRPGEGEGVPVIFSSFHLLGRADFIASVGLAERPVGWKATPVSKLNERRDEMPLENDVLSFP